LSRYDALDAAGQVIDKLNEAAYDIVKFDNTLDVLLALSSKRIALTRLDRSLNARNLLPVTLNTLSVLLAESYVAISH
jgi:hypothetical protein